MKTKPDLQFGAQVIVLAAARSAPLLAASFNQAVFGG
jgi:hypothetical protein